MIDGRMTRIQTTTRPPHIWPEMWQAMSKKQKEIAVADWARDKKLLDEARQCRGLVIGVDGGGTRSHRCFLPQPTMKKSGAALPRAKLGSMELLRFHHALCSYSDQCNKNTVTRTRLLGIMLIFHAWLQSKFRSKKPSRYQQPKLHLAKNGTIYGLSRHGMPTPSVSTTRFATGLRRVVRLLILVVFLTFAH